MIHFYRKIRKGLIRQDRIGKYLLYVVGEILLVVIGIIIALQINNWNEQRKNLLKKQSLLASIKTEFQSNLIQLDSVLSYNQKVISGCLELLNYHRQNDKKISEDSLRHSILKINYV